MKTEIKRKLMAALFVFLLSFCTLSLHAEETTPFYPHYIIAVDNSGSMKENDASQRTRAFMLSFFKRLKLNDKVTIITFGTTGKIVIARHVNSLGEVGILRSRVVGLPFNESYTDMKDGFDFVLDYEDSKRVKEEQALVLFLTDGKLSLVSSLKLSFPEKFLNNDDYAGLLSKFRPYIFGNSIERDMVTAFDEGMNELGERLIYRDIIPRLKEEITPLFILSFSEEDLLLKKIAGSIALKSGMENYFQIGNVNDEENFIRSFFLYVTDLMALRESKRLEKLKELQEAEELQTESSINDDTGVISPVTEEVSSKGQKEDIATDTTLLKQEDVFKATEKENDESSIDDGTDINSPATGEHSFKTIPQKQETSNNKYFPLAMVLIVSTAFLALMALIILITRVLKGKKGIVKTVAVLEDISNISDGIDFTIPTKLDYNEKRLSFRHEIPPDTLITFVFSSDGLEMDGNLTNISENGCEIIIGTINTGELPATGVKGDLEINYKVRSYKITPVTIAAIDKEHNCCGLSMNELEYNPDIKLLWIEMYTGIINDIKER